MARFRCSVLLTFALALAVAPSVAVAQANEDPCTCPVAGRDRGGVAGLLGLAALGLARLGTGVRSFVAEPAEGPVLASAPPEAGAPVAAAPLVPADTGRDTTEVQAAPPGAPGPAAPVTPAAPREVAMAAPGPDAPVGIPAPRTATLLPLLALLGATALLVGGLLLLRGRAARVPASGARLRRVAPPQAVILLGRQHARPRYRIR